MDSPTTIHAKAEEMIHETHGAVNGLRKVRKQIETV